MVKAQYHSNGKYTLNSIKTLANIFWVYVCVCMYVCRQTREYKYKKSKDNSVKKNKFEAFSLSAINTYYKLKSSKTVWTGEGIEK